MKAGPSIALVRYIYLPPWSVILPHSYRCGVTDMASAVPPIPSGSPPLLHAPIGGSTNGWDEYYQRYHQSINDPVEFWTNEANKYLGMHLLPLYN